MRFVVRFRHDVLPATGELPARLGPERLEKPVCEFVVTQCRAAHRVHFAAAGKSPAEGDLAHILVRRNGYPSLIASTRPGRNPQAVNDIEIFEVGIQSHTDPGIVSVGLEEIANYLEVRHQGIRCHVVGAQRLPVECGGIVVTHIEVAVINEQIAVDFPDAFLAHAPEQLPETLGDQVRIPVSLEHQVAIEYVACDFAHE